jgi:hypothetical protein
MGPGPKTGPPPEGGRVVRCSGRWIGSGEARRTALGLLACGTEAGVGLRNLDGRHTQSCDLDCRQGGQYRQWSGARALRIRTGRIRLRVMMPGGTIMGVMTLCVSGVMSLERALCVGIT